MQLPQDLQRFPQPTLIVVADEQTAKIWLAGGDSLEPLDGVTLPPERLSDAEGSFVSYDGSRVAGPASDLHDTPRKEAFAKKLAERVAGHVREGHAESICLSAVPEMLHRIDAHLPKDIRERVRSRLDQNLMQLSAVEIIRRLLTPPFMGGQAVIA